VLEGEIRALGAIAASSIARPTAVAREVHGAVTGRVFGALGLLGAPVRAIHDPLSTISYRAVGASLRAPLSAGTRAVARSAPASATSLAQSPAGALALGAANGVFGDRLASEHPELTVRFGFWRDGTEIELDEEAVAAAYADATPRLAVFVHGLCETEIAWSAPYPGSAPRPTYGERLHAELGITPVYLRYNTGLHVSDNGRALAASLDELVTAWPVEVDSISLVGHSMGGLVARSACRYAELEDRPSAQRVGQVICLGTPHLGAPLERAANVAAWPLTRLAETRPFADLFLNGRSAGIKDLRYGSCVEEDWRDCDPDEFLHDRCCEVPFLDSANYYFVAATLAPTTGGTGGLVGDLLVTYQSASGVGRRRRIGFAAENGRHVPRADHLRLLNHPAVYEQIRDWLGSS